MTTVCVSIRETPRVGCGSKQGMAPAIPDQLRSLLQGRPETDVLSCIHLLDTPAIIRDSYESVKNLNSIHAAAFPI